MKVAVRYHSRGGNTKKVAEAIATATGAAAEDCAQALDQPVDLLFLGGSVYAFGLDEATKNFIAGLEPRNVQAVALFGTSAMVKTGNEEMAKLLRAKGIRVLDNRFYCRGAFSVAHRGRPNAKDLEEAKDFALAAQKELEQGG